MRLEIQALGVPLLAAISAATGSAVASAVAHGAGVCDPKFGCTFGLQFGAGLSGAIGLFLGIVLLCVYAGYSAATRKLIPQRVSLVLAAMLGLAVGVAISAVTAASYM